MGAKLLQRAKPRAKVRDIVAAHIHAVMQNEKRFDDAFATAYAKGDHVTLRELQALADRNLKAAQS